MAANRLSCRLLIAVQTRERDEDNVKEKESTVKVAVDDVETKRDVEYSTFGWVEDDLHASSSTSTEASTSLTTTESVKLSWLKWLASKSKLTTQRPTTSTRFRSNDVKDAFEELLLDKLHVPGLCLI